MADEDPVDPTDPVEVDTTGGDVKYSRDRGAFTNPMGSLHSQLAKVKNVPDAILSIPAPVGTGTPGGAFESRYTSGNIITGGSGAVPRGAIFSNDATRPEADARFSFQYNPSSLTISTAWDVSNPTVFGTGADASGEGGGALIDTNLGLANSPETLGVQVLLNRIVEASSVGNPAGDQAALFATYGTLVDLSILYRTINCLSDADVEEAIKANPNVVPATNVGFLTAGKLVIMFGNGVFIWEGYCTGITVNHVKFVSTMCPVLTTCDLSFQRTIGSGAGDPEVAKIPGANTAAGAERNIPLPKTTTSPAKPAPRPTNGGNVTPTPSRGAPTPAPAPAPTPKAGLAP